MASSCADDHPFPLQIHALIILVGCSTLGRNLMSPFTPLCRLYSPMSSSPSLVITLGSAPVTTSMILLLAEAKELLVSFCFCFCFCFSPCCTRCVWIIKDERAQDMGLTRFFLMGILRAAAASRSLDGVVAAGRHRIVLLQRYATCTDSLTRTNQLRAHRCKSKCIALLE